MSALKVPSVPACCVCGKTILAGTGLYVSEPVRGVRFCHSGACARSAGAAAPVTDAAVAAALREVAEEIAVLIGVIDTRVGEHLRHAASGGSVTAAPDWLRLFEERAQQELAEAIHFSDPDAERRARERWISASAHLSAMENAKQEPPYAIN